MAQETASKLTSKKHLKGVVFSGKMDKTLVVAVNTLKEHPKYKKRYRATKKYKVHDERNFFKKGDWVEFIECRPLSRGKSWRVVYPAGTPQVEAENNQEK